MRYLAGLFSFFLLFAVLSCHKRNLFFESNDSVISDHVSPDGRLAVTVIERDCGTTADFSTILVLRKADSSPNADRDRMFVASGRHAVDVMWNQSTSVVINCSATTSDVFRAETVMGPVSIRYR